MSELIYALAGVGCLVLGLGYGMMAVIMFFGYEQAEIPARPKCIMSFAATSALALTMALCFWLGRHLLLLAWGMR